MRLRGWSGAGGGVVATCLAIACLLASGASHQIFGLIARPEPVQKSLTDAEPPDRGVWWVRLQLKVCEVNREPIQGLSERLSRLSQNPLASGILRGDALHTPFKRADADACLAALSGMGVLKTVCEPTLATRSGQQAIFQPTDDSDAPVVDEGDSSGDTKVQVVGLGVELCFRPIVLRGGGLQLQVAGFPSAASDGSSCDGQIGQPANHLVELQSDEVLAINGKIPARKQPKAGLAGLIKFPVRTRFSGERRPTPKESELIVVVIPEVEVPDSEQVAGIDLPTR